MFELRIFWMYHGCIATRIFRNTVLVHRIFRFSVRTITIRFDGPYCILQPETHKDSFSEVTMLTNPQPPRSHLPNGWQDCVTSM